MVHVGCWAHARRHFIDAVKLNPSDPIATAIVRRMDELFGADAEARAQNFDHAARPPIKRFGRLIRSPIKSVLPRPMTLRRRI